MNLNILDMLYTLIIGPLKLLMEIIFWLGNRITSNYGLSIIFLSFCLNILLLPLYNRADKIQEEENNIEKKLKPGVDHIKKTFKGDERYMILQTYYRQNNYNQLNVLKGSIPLLLEIPFFMAAYSFIVTKNLFVNVSFGPIVNLGKPDGLLNGINILPILMTIVNIVSCLIYTKGQPLKSKIQLFLMAVLFLILLYDCPSALTIYYLFNNIFSLIKNILLRLENRKYYLAMIGILVCIGSYVFVYTYRLRWKLYVKVVLILLITLVLLFCIFTIFNRKKKPISINTDIRKSSHWISLIFISILVGLFIPSRLISISPEEFVDIHNVINPINYIINSFLLSCGTFLLWINVYYTLMKNSIKKVLDFILSILCFVFLIDYLFFGIDLGNISNMLIYDVYPEFSLSDYMINGIVVIFISVFVVLINKKFDFSRITIIVIVTLISLSVIDLTKINKAYSQVKDRVDVLSDDNISLPLSKNDRNVVIIMLDRAISEFFPYILEEKPELKQQFSGFVYYPNTISFGGTTNTSVPSLYGGYEYTPEEIEKRDKELLKDKHDEALKVLPVLFDNNDYEVTVWDPPYAGYSWVPDLSIYDDYPNINTSITEGKYTISQLDSLNRNLFMYGISRVVPTLFFNRIYTGNYMSIENNKLTNFNNWYSVLTHFSDLTTFNDSNGSFLYLQNSVTHEPTLLTEDNYEYNDELIIYNNEIITKELSNGKKMVLDNYNKLAHYHTNVASLIQLGKWFDYLKINGVYDNTKIIVVSDHGYDLGIDNNLIVDNKDILNFNALLLVKDFDSTEFKTSDEFMTLADVAYLATNEVIDNPINPFTNNKIVKVEKENKPFNVYQTYVWNIELENGNTFKNGRWFSVHDNCKDINNWKLLTGK